MPDRRHAIAAVLLAACTLWALAAWLLAPDAFRAIPPGAMWHKVIPVALGALLAIYLFFAISSERPR